MCRPPPPAGRLLALVSLPSSPSPVVVKEGARATSCLHCSAAAAAPSTLPPKRPTPSPPFPGTARQTPSASGRRLAHRFRRRAGATRVGASRSGSRRLNAPECPLTRRPRGGPRGSGSGGRGTRVLATRDVRALLQRERANQWRTNLLLQKKTEIRVGRVRSHLSFVGLNEQ